MGKAWYSKKWMTIFIHAICWVILFSFPALLRPSHNPNDINMVKALNTKVIFFISRVSDLLLISFFYLNAFLFIPRFLYKRKYLLYAFQIIFYFAFYLAVMWTLWSKFTKMDFTFNAHFVVSFFVSVHFCLQHRLQNNPRQIYRGAGFQKKRKRSILKQNYPSR